MIITIRTDAPRYKADHSLHSFFDVTWPNMENNEQFKKGPNAKSTYNDTC